MGKMLKLIVKYDSYYRNDAILSIMCVKGVPYSGPSSYQEMLGLSMFFPYPI